MVLKIPYLFFKSINLLRSNKKIMLYSLIPVMIGFFAYYFLGSWVFGDLRVLGEAYIAKHFDVSGWIGDVFLGFLVLLFAVFMNWTFFILVSVVAAPFNDLISAHVEIAYEQRTESEDTFKDTLKKLPTIFGNEFKKLAFIAFLSFINILIGFTFPPASFLFAGMILAISFVDYSWSRNELEFKECLSDFKKGFLPYMLGGIAFMFLISVPLINLFFLPLAVVFFSVIFCELRLKNA